MRTDTQRDYERRVLNVLVHIQNHLDEPLPLEELAEIACFSPFHFHRVFRGLVGEPVREHVRRLRLERAAFQLWCSSQPVTQIALDAGYETHEAFTRAFRSRFDKSPTEFREDRRKALIPAADAAIVYQPDGQLTNVAFRHHEGEQMEARIENVPTERVAFFRHIGPYEQCGATWGKLCGWAGSRGLFGPNTRMFGVSHDDPEVTPPEKIRYDACIAVGPDFEADGEVSVQEIGGGEYAIGMHKGPYEGMVATYGALMGQWIPQQNRQLGDGPCLERYLNDPNTTPPEELLTEIMVPLKPQ